MKLGKMAKSVLFLLLVGMFSVAIVACKKVEIENVGKQLMFPAITTEDLETIDYVNQNSDYAFTLLDEVYAAENGSGQPYIEISDDGNVHSYGFYIEEKQAIIRTQISLNGPSDRNILGVHNGDTYKEARELIEKAGFTCVEKRLFRDDIMLEIYSKGIVELWMNVMKDEAKDSDEIADDDIIDSISITIPLDDGQNTNVVID